MPNFSLSHKRMKVAVSIAVRRRPADLRQVRRDLAQGPPNSNRKLARNRIPRARTQRARERAKKSSGGGGVTGAMAMKLFTGWALSAGLVVAASAANAQIPAPNDVGGAHYQAASDVAEPYGGMPPGAFPPPHYGYEPALLPPQEVYAVLRENGFSPLGIPRQRGYV